MPTLSDENIEENNNNGPNKKCNNTLGHMATPPHKDITIAEQDNQVVTQEAFDAMKTTVKKMMLTNQSNQR